MATPTIAAARDEFAKGAGILTAPGHVNGQTW